MKITIVIPAYNVEDYISECLYSVYAQTYTNIEIICVDDGSTDKTSKIILGQKNQSPFDYKVITRENGGQCAARNSGLEQSSGDYVHFLDADDIMHPNKITNIVNLIKAENNPPSFIVGDYIRKPYRKKEFVKKADYRNAWYGLFSSRLGISSSLTWNRECLISAGGWNENAKTSVEYELMFRMIRQGYTYIHDTQPLITVRERAAGSITQTNTRDNIVRFIELRKKMLNYLQNENLMDNTLQNHAYQTLFINIKWLYKYDPGKSIALYRDIIPKSFIPKISSALSKKYIHIYKVFGYPIAQKLWYIIHYFSGNNSTTTVHSSAQNATS